MIKNIRKRILLALPLLVILAVVIFILLEILPVMVDIFRMNDQNAIKAELRSFGFRGVLILIFLQIIQIFSIFLPSGAVQVAAGITYGPVFGMLICLVGIIIGNTIVFCTAKRFGKNFVELVLSEKMEKTFSFLNRTKHLDVIFFLLYVLPGMPNGFLPYLASMTKISLPKFLAVIISASAPSILLCTYVGEHLANGNYKAAGIIIGIFLFVCAVLFFVKNKLLHKIEKID